MGKFNGKGSYSQLQSMRARLRKASCMNDDAYDEVAHLDEPPPPAMPASGEDSLSLRPSSSSSSSSGIAIQRDGETYEQLQSAFFARLPAELRRMIYRALWRSSNPLMKMHVHAACDGVRLTTTPCQYAPAATYSTRDDDADPMRTDPWPGWKGRNQPPRWFWHAWGLRLRWGPHWKCQAAAMLDWKAKGDGTCVDLKRGQDGWLKVFLCCRRMYAEAIESLFESTTLIFTASEDAYRFFVQNPHSYLHKLHSLDLAFSHFKDHLFLQRIEALHPRLPDSSSTAPVGWELWVPLMLTVREQMPNLARLRVQLSPPSAKAEGFVDVLREWEREGYGWVTEQADGVVYLEMGRRRTVVGAEEG